MTSQPKLRRRISRRVRIIFSAFGLAASVGLGLVLIHDLSGELVQLQLSRSFVPDTLTLDEYSRRFEVPPTLLIRALALDRISTDPLSETLGHLARSRGQSPTAFKRELVRVTFEYQAMPLPPPGRTIDDGD